jgi:ATP-dependent helicase/nuclease subunit A
VLANLRALLGVSLELGGGRFATPYAFVRNLKAGGVLAPVAVNPQAVRLLTIHGAKGLEAKAVLLLDTDNPDRNAESMGVLIDWPGEAAWPTKFVFLTSESKPPACAASALAAEQLERQREELNALYVAMTRARHTLVISSIAPYRAAERSWWQRLVDLAQPVTLALPDDAAPAASASAESAVTGVFYLPELPSFDQPDRPVAVKTIALDAAQDAVLARIGCAMHRLLQWGDASGHSILATAREFDLTPEQGSQAGAMAQCILQGEGAWAWDPAVVTWQGNEVDLFYQGQTLRLDRLVQRQDGDHAGQWWVLDYKSAHSPQDQPALVQQLRGYRAAMQAIYPNALVKAAFLTASGDLIEVSHSD